MHLEVWTWRYRSREERKQSTQSGHVEGFPGEEVQWCLNQVLELEQKQINKAREDSVSGQVFCYEWMWGVGEARGEAG